MVGWVLGEQAGLSVGPEPIAGALAAQRYRFLGYLRGLDERGWTAPTRCGTWSAHHVARHMVDTSRINAARLAGRPPVFPADGPFDPTRTPDVWLQTSANQSPEDTMAAFEVAIADEVDSFQAQVSRRGSDLAQGPGGRQAHWSNVPLHMLWDAWLHERDVRLPAGGTPESTVEELRLVAMYGLQVAAVPPLITGIPLETTIALGGPDCCYRVSCSSGGEVIVAAEDSNEAVLWGDLCTVLDALAGRGPRLADVLAGKGDDVDKLSWLAAFMTAETE